MGEFEVTELLSDLQLSFFQRPVIKWVTLKIEDRLWFDFVVYHSAPLFNDMDMVGFSKVQLINKKQSGAPKAKAPCHAESAL